MIDKKYEKFYSNSFQKYETMVLVTIVVKPLS